MCTSTNFERVVEQLMTLLSGPYLHLYIYIGYPGPSIVDSNSNSKLPKWRAAQYVCQIIDTSKVAIVLNSIHTLHRNTYFELIKNLWGCHSNSNNLLSSVATQDTTTCQNNATTYIPIQKVHEHTQFHSCRHGHTDRQYNVIHFPFFESFLIWSCTKQSG